LIEKEIFFQAVLKHKLLKDRNGLPRSSPAKRFCEQATVSHRTAHTHLLDRDLRSTRKPVVNKFHSIT